MIARNDITGDALRTKGSNDAYRSGWDRIFGKKEPEPSPAPAPEPVKVQTVEKTDAQLEADALRQEWWKYCQENQASFTTPFPSGNLIPSFEEWRQLVGR